MVESHERRDQVSSSRARARNNAVCGSLWTRITGCSGRALFIPGESTTARTTTSVSALLSFKVTHTWRRVCPPARSLARLSVRPPDNPASAFHSESEFSAYKPPARASNFHLLFFSARDRA